MRSTVILVLGFAAVGGFVLWSLRREPLLPNGNGDLPKPADPGLTLNVSRGIW